MNNERKKAGAEAVDYINKYLISAGWQLNRDVNPTLK